MIPTWPFIPAWLPSLIPSGPRLPRSTLSLGTVVGTWLCTATCADTPPDPDYGILEIASPAGPGSGQPSLETLEDAVLLAWTEGSAGEGHRLLTATLRDGWDAPRLVVERTGLFVNWADFSLVKRTGPGTLAAHWLVRYPAGGAAYRIEAAFSRDGGATWSEPWTPHEDGTVSEHGFVSWFGMPDGGTGLVWLDGRGYAASEAEPSDGDRDGHAGPQMSLRFRSVATDGSPSPETVLDPRTCDCCQTTVASTADGPIVAYRGRSDDEIRDIEVVRWAPGGWSEPRLVHADGWRIEGCPVNGPALAARDRDVAIVWFTAAAGTPRVKLAFSSDAGRSFGDPVVVDDGHPEGRVDVVMTPDRGVWISWLERTEGGADVRVRRVAGDGRAANSLTVAASSESRASGFPRMAIHPRGGLVLAWTDPTEPGSVRVARIQERGETP